MMTDEADQSLMRLVAEIVAAYVGANQLPTARLPEVIRSVHEALATAENAGEVPAAVPPKPAVPIRRSVTPDFIVCLEDGRKLKMLRRHLRTTYGLSPEQYRTKWGLPVDYPMVAPNYAARRSEFARQIGLGRKTPSKPTVPEKKRRRVSA